MSTVYLLHFQTPIGNLSNVRAQAQHYIGWTPLPIEERLAEHRAGRGSAITRAARSLGVAWELVATWDGDYRLEKRLKRLHAAPRLCPICGRKHPNGKLHVTVQYTQLELPLFDEWPAIPVEHDRMSWMEIQHLRTRPAMCYGQLDLNTTDCDIPL